MVGPNRALWCGLLLSSLLLGVAVEGAPARGEGCTAWPVNGKLLGKDGGKSFDISGIACTRNGGFPRSCLVIDDEIQSAQRVIVADRAIEAGQSIALIDNRHKGKPLELDGEGVAYADGFFYVIGSHGSPRNASDDAADPKVKARIVADSQLARIEVDPDSGDPVVHGGNPAVELTARLRDVIAAQPALRRFVDQPLDDNGVTIEGVAARDGRLFIGFRGPSALDGDKAAILSVAASALFDGGDPDPRLSLVPLSKGRGVRDLVAYRSGFLVLAGPTLKGEGTYSVFWWDGAGGAPELLGDLPRFDGDDGKQVKAEALLPLDEGAAGLRVLVLFDGAKKGGPQACRIAMP